MLSQHESLSFLRSSTASSIISDSSWTQTTVKRPACSEKRLKDETELCVPSVGVGHLYVPLRPRCFLLLLLARSRWRLRFVLRWCRHHFNWVRQSVRSSLNVSKLSFFWIIIQFSTNIDGSQSGFHLPSRPSAAACAAAVSAASVSSFQTEWCSLSDSTWDTHEVLHSEVSDVSEDHVLTGSICIIF